MLCKYEIRCPQKPLQSEEAVRTAGTDGVHNLIAGQGAFESQFPENGVSRTVGRPGTVRPGKDESWCTDLFQNSLLCRSQILQKGCTVVFKGFSGNMVGSLPACSVITVEIPGMVSDFHKSGRKHL